MSLARTYSIRGLLGVSLCPWYPQLDELFRRLLFLACSWLLRRLKRPVGLGASVGGTLQEHDAVLLIGSIIFATFGRHCEQLFSALLRCHTLPSSERSQVTWLADVFLGSCLEVVAAHVRRETVLESLARGRRLIVDLRWQCACALLLHWILLTLTGRNRPTSKNIFAYLLRELRARASLVF